MFSFNGNKIMTTSGGGMLLSNDEELIERARYLSTQARQPADYYQHTEIGFNYRLSNLLAALGRAQLSRLDGMLARRRAIRQMYVEELADVPGVRFLGRDEGRGDDEDNCWLTCIELDPAVTELNPSQLIAELASEKIESRRLWTHRQGAAVQSPLHGAGQSLSVRARCLHPRLGLGKGARSRTRLATSANGCSRRWHGSPASRR